jgi:hexosaminidase
MFKSCGEYVVLKSIICKHLFIPRPLFLLAFLLSFIVLKAVSQPTGAQYPIIPYPAQLTPAPGHFIITPATTIVLPAGPRYSGTRPMHFNVLLAHSFGQPLANGAPASKKAIRLIDSSIEAEEGYRLTITPLGMTVAARTAAGMFMAVQTIRQLLPARQNGQMDG